MEIQDFAMTVTEDKYRPLPDYLTIKPSEIEGLGLFTLKDLEEDKSLGMTHLYRHSEPNHYLRTPLGGFINHSKEPNCHLVTVTSFGPRKFLYTKRKIKAGEELTVKYTMYEV